MITYIYFEPSQFRPAILAFPQLCCVATPLGRVPYGAQDSAAAPHRRDYTSDDAQAICDWLNRRTEYLTHLRFPSAAPVGPEQAKEAVPATTPPGGERGVPSASDCDADALEDTITLSEHELAEAELLVSRESY